MTAAATCFSQDKLAVQRVSALRELMKQHNVQAYYVPSEDAHQSEYIAAWDARRAFLTGFTGSCGFAVITGEEAALWTDGRYFNQAEKQLNPAVWTLMRAGLPETPKKEDWLLMKLKAGDRVGVDPQLINFENAQKIREQLGKQRIELTPINKNLVDAIWTDRPIAKLQPIIALGDNYAGKSIKDKLKWLREEHLQVNNCSGILISALDEIAWLFNLRGSDIPFNPVFFAYAFVSLNKAILFTDQPERIKEKSDMFDVVPYSHVFEHAASCGKHYCGKPLWVGTNCNLALVDAAGGCDAVLAKTSPIQLEKAIKNETELAGFRKCHIRDAAAVCKYFAWLEDELLKKGNKVTECQGADRLEAFRREDPECVGLSFDTISGSGPNGAIIHYKPEPNFCAQINSNELYLCDSGGQYYDGTTDITRTLHFGRPSEEEKRFFTLVLKGVISLASCTFPRGTKGIQLDVLARQFLWRHGLDYRHGTGHGVGHFLNVHEGPHYISFRSGGPDDADLRPGMTVTDEPGYYEDGKFGIRIENCLIVVERETEFKFVKCLGFETITMVPIQRKMIDMSLLEREEVEWLNKYHQECRAKVSPLLSNHPEALDWLIKETEPFSK